MLRESPYVIKLSSTVTNRLLNDAGNSRGTTSPTCTGDSIPTLGDLLRSLKYVGVFLNWTTKARCGVCACRPSLLYHGRRISMTTPANFPLQVHLLQWRVRLQRQLAHVRARVNVARPPRAV
jgi:hypothetical protein